MLTPEESARMFIGADALSGIGYEHDLLVAEQAIRHDRKLPQNDGSLHAATVTALRDRATLDFDEAEGYGYRQRAIDWINAHPDEFWVEFAGPMLDDIEQKFITEMQEES